ncbi:MAG: hypothetical protein COX77_03405 [Candidatus Komeilibacteria bacterium CG_4_10_14_0_2_um_filter_37_10]|uniref:Dipeptidylpeptidase IV N-terminal domain-containing protein n=1 Tax=Candidatus Komeilibacteria bacterium CG_4_10_14_0_2_um_filter_37_10 TaxID=1974470 RepID=A0A2M7VE72_9BACT|nr:MAG: hypothetical protein COX77_03405 [Candidatus Komeilibacteria bacterium CG_4_10_14_0_2_um_filter_37_10]
MNVINIQTKEIKQIFGPVTNILYPQWITNEEIAFIYENKTSRENFIIFDIWGKEKKFVNKNEPIFFYTFDNDTGAADQSVIKSVTLDGTTQELTAPAFIDPVLSPAGTKVVYYQYTGPGKMMTMNIDGSEQVNIITESGITDPTWSSNGKIIAYSVEQDDGMAILAWDIYAINADGTDKIKLTDSGKQFAAHPRWSADGKKLVFDYQENGKIVLLIFK